MKNNKQNKINKNRKSLKGKWGRVGAPPKATKFPRGAFTMESLFNMNKNQCELSLRNKVDDKLADGSLIALKTRKQKGGKVGRPKAVFVLKENFDKDKHEKADTKAKTPKAKTRTVVTVSTTPVAPTAPPVPAAAAAVPSPSPEVTAPVETAATVEVPVSTPASEPVVG
jgi:hypothetical protein